jgi:NADH-quinone oxidoreductase subunit N
MATSMLIDYATPVHFIWALMPEIVLSVFAMVVLMVDVFQKGQRSEPSRPVVTWLALAGLGAAALANLWLMRSVQEATGVGMVAIDGFRIFTNFLFLLAGGLFVLISTRYLEQERMRLGEVYVLVLLSVVGMMVFAGSRDLILVFLGLELMSLSIYVLVGANRRDPRSAEAALKYFLLGAFSSAFFLFGIALVFGGAGTTNIALASIILGVDGLGANPLVILGLGFLLVGFSFKVAAVPFHMWAPDAYTGAPAPITAFMAAAVKAAGFAAFLRVFLTGFPGLYERWGGVVILLALLTMIVPNVVALSQGTVKRMLAYSSVAHAGYLLVALSAASLLGAASFLFYLLAYTLMTIGAFGVVLLVAQRGEARLDLESYSGLGWQRPLLAVAMTIFLLSLAGFPATGGFIGKIYILRAALETGKVQLAVVLVMASLVSYWYYLRVAWYMWFRDPVAGAAVMPPISRSMAVALGIAVVGLLFLGLFPGPVMQWAEASAASLLAPPLFLGSAGP